MWSTNSLPIIFKSSFRVSKESCCDSVIRHWLMTFRGTTTDFSENHMKHITCMKESRRLVLPRTSCFNIRPVSLPDGSVVGNIVRSKSGWVLLSSSWCYFRSRLGFLCFKKFVSWGRLETAGRCLWGSVRPPERPSRPRTTQRTRTAHEPTTSVFEHDCWGRKSRLCPAQGLCAMEAS
jgi:hypothetical protein